LKNLCFKKQELEKKEKTISGSSELKKKRKTNQKLKK